MGYFVLTLLSLDSKLKTGTSAFSIKLSAMFQAVAMIEFTTKSAGTMLDLAFGLNSAVRIKPKPPPATYPVGP